MTHTYKDELIEFLAEPENMNFLLEVEPLIPEVKRHKLEKSKKIFLNKYIASNIEENLGSGFEIKISDHDYIISNKNTSENTFCFAIYLGPGDSNYYFGIIGPSNSKVSELNALKEELLGQSMNKPWKHWITWKFFSRKREELLTLTDSTSDEIFIDWSTSFWDFVSIFSDKVREVNKLHKEVIA